MPAQPEHLRSHVEGLGHVTGAPVHGLDADPVAHLASFIDGAVVAVEHSRTDGAALRVEGGDRGTLSGQADRDGSMASPEKPPEGAQRLRGALAPIIGVLFRPPGSRLACRVGAAHLGDHPTLQVDRDRSRSARADINRDERSIVGRPI